MTNALKTSLRKDGFVILRSVLTPSDLKPMRRELSALFSKSARDDHLTIVKAHRVELGTSFAQEVIQEVICSAIGPSPCLVMMEAVRCRPGQRHGTLVNRESHIDLHRPRSALSVNVLLALDPCVELNGAPRVAISSHRLGPGHPERPVAPSFDGRLVETLVVETATTPLIMEPGDMTLILGTTWRRQGENRSDATRLHLEATYCQKDAIRYFDPTFKTE